MRSDSEIEPHGLGQRGIRRHSSLATARSLSMAMNGSSLSSSICCFCLACDDCKSARTRRYATVSSNLFASQLMRLTPMTRKTRVPPPSDHPKNSPWPRTGPVERRRPGRPEQVSPELIRLLRFPPRLGMRAPEMEGRTLGEAIARRLGPPPATPVPPGIAPKAP